MNFDTTLQEYRFDTKENAQAFKTAVKQECSIRVTKVSLKKSLPEFRNIVCNDYSVFVKCFAFADQIPLGQLAKHFPGRVTRDPKTSLRIVQEGAHV